MKEQGHYRWEEGKWVPARAALVEHLIGNRRGILRTDHAYLTKAGRVVIAREGMEFDGGSKPRFSWGVIGHPWEDYLLDYIIHDALRIRAQEAFKSGDVTRTQYREMMRESDKIFKESQRWTKQNLLDKAGNMVQRAVINAKYGAVRLHAWWRECVDVRKI